ncbi:MAG TPA: Fic family protein [Lapillicoccus sp.]|nr:Fic family protein [Lapillicoccus sp.]
MPPDDVAARLRALGSLPGVAEASEAAREACTRLRFEEALRRRMPEAAAESRVRGARASAALDGAEVKVDRVRSLVGWGTDPVDVVVRGAVQATVESEHVVGLVLSAPWQALARLHVAAMAGVLASDQVGRPRGAGEEVRELVEVGPAPPDVSGRLASLVEVCGAAGSPGVPGLVVAALVHAEVATLRPFVRGNGVVARAAERAVLQATGLDPTGVAVPEVGHLRGGLAAYVGALAAYASGSADGVALWLRHCGDAVVAGADEGMRVCAAVRAGRLS